MGGINGDCRSQRVARALEAGFQNVVGVLARELHKMDGGHALAEAVRIDAAHRDEIPSTKGLLV